MFIVSCGVEKPNRDRPSEHVEDEKRVECRSVSWRQVANPSALLE